MKPKYCGIWFVVGIAALILNILMVIDVWWIVRFGKALFPTVLSVIK